MVVNLNILRHGGFENGDTAGYNGLTQTAGRDLQTYYVRKSTSTTTATTALTLFAAFADRPDISNTGGGTMFYDYNFLIQNVMIHNGSTTDATLCQLAIRKVESSTQECLLTPPFTIKAGDTFQYGSRLTPLLAWYDQSISHYAQPVLLFPGSYALTNITSIVTGWVYT
jgi:hypothetical protein